VATDPAAFRKVGDRVELRGTVVSNAPQVVGAGRTTVFELPEGYRPSVQLTFRVDSEHGPTVVTVLEDGSVVADAIDGWVSLNGISFTTAE
jgi:hypothetical protein